MSTEPIVLLVRADDIGSSQAANEACMAVFSHGIARSVEIMAPCAWFPAAVKQLQAQPDYDVGVHLVLTSEWETIKWRPLSDAKSLVNEDGYFCASFGRSPHVPDALAFGDLAWTVADVAKELSAQIELTRKHLPWVSHLSMHMGGLRSDRQFMAIIEMLAAEYDLAVDLTAHGFQRFPGFGAQSTALLPAEKTQALLENLATLTPGKWIFVDHPAYDTPEMRATHHNGYENVALDRQGVTDAWTDPQVRALIAQRKIRLTSYGDVKRGLVP